MNHEIKTRYIHKENSYFTVTKSYSDPFDENLQYVYIIQNSPILYYDKRQSRDLMECDIHAHSFYMDKEKHFNGIGIDEIEFLSRLLDQTKEIQLKFGYEKAFLVKLLDNNSEYMGKLLKEYTNIDYTSNDLEKMIKNPYTR